MEILARTPQQLGAGIRRYRRQKDLTQGGLGEKMHARQATVSKLEAGEPATQLRTLMDALAALDLETDHPAAHQDVGQSHRGSVLMGRRPIRSPLNVYLNARLVGRLRRESSGAIDFQYDKTWLDWENAIPVSVSMPLREDRYIGDLVVAVFDRLPWWRLAVLRNDVRNTTIDR
jgi:transcriptional regulator with XRE-family HTH domain